MINFKFISQVLYTLTALLVVCGVFCTSGFAQDDFFDVNEENAESADGLDSATPTDNINEVNPGGGNVYSDEAFGSESDFPAATEGNSGNFNLNTGNANNIGDNFFSDEPAANAESADEGGISAFGSNQPVNNTATPNPATPGNANPLQQAVPQQVPMQQVPANAQSLLNQINSAPVNPLPANQTAPLNPAPQEIPPADVVDAASQEALLPSNPEPVIQAPPLPPPNEFAGSPPVPGSLRILAESEAPEEYLVQPGDTLFDICDQLLDEPGYWPKLWALNPEIKNPHFIFPNMRLKFYPGDDETPPYLQVVAEEEVIPIEKGNLDEEELIAETVIFEEEEVFDDSLSVEVVGPEQVDDLADGVIFSGPTFRSYETQVQVPGFIYSDEKEPMGFVVSGRNGEFNMGPGRGVVIESNGGISNGTLFTVLRPGPNVRDPATNDFIGYRYEFVGNIRIVRKLSEDDMFIGNVESARLGIMPNDILVAYISTLRTVPLTQNVAPSSSASASVVGFQYGTQLFSGEGGFAFISKGSGDGISTGMYLPIYSTPGRLAPELKGLGLPVDPEIIGVMRIIDATEAGAVGYIVKNSKEVRVGDRTDKG